MGRTTFRIALIGAHSTGKTTLLHRLKERSKSLKVASIEGVTRRLISEGFPMGKNTVLDSWVKFIAEQLHQERLLMSESHDMLVSDRTVLDAAVYASVNKSLPRPYIPDYFVTMLREVAILEASCYDLFAYCPIEFPMTSDGVRDEDENYRSAIDRGIRMILEESGLEFVMLTGSVADRFETLVSRCPTNIKDAVRLRGANASRREVAQPASSAAVNSSQTVEAEQELVSAGYADVIESTLFNRLEGVSFLGVLDYVYDLPRTSNRREHSIAAAQIALRLSERLALSREEGEILVLANLLHDVGHAPFSHNSEPFLVESRNVYHYGLLTTYLRHGPDSIGEEYSIATLLKHRTAALRESVSSLLMKRRHASLGILQSLFVSPLNCDKIEGNYRTLQLLHREGVDPALAIGCFERRGNCVFVRSDALDVVERFWSLEVKLYWDLIYTSEVFAAEAMLTRALTTVFSTDERATAFALSTDDDVIDKLKRDRRAGKLFTRIEANSLYAPLSVIDARLYESVRSQMAPARFDWGAREAIERELAAKLGINAEGVISHYSRRKHFATDISGLRQRTLFEAHPEIVPLDDVNTQLSSTKVSGDLFEVFCDMPARDAPAKGHVGFGHSR